MDYLTALPDLMNENVKIARDNAPKSNKEGEYCEIKKAAKMPLIRNIANNRGDRIVLIRSEEAFK